MIDLYLMDMTRADNTSGVDRYMHTLARGLSAYSHFRVYWIQLSYDPELILYREEDLDGVTKITLPMPQQKQEIIGERFWIRKYNEQVYRLARHLFEGRENCVLHLNTVNLIDLALLIREHVPCRIIAHLHCIPWKGYYDSDRFRFNQLYSQASRWAGDPGDAKSFLTNNCEWQFYSEADRIVCVTRCAAGFLSGIMQVPAQKITIIPNGMPDVAGQGSSEEKVRDGVFTLLYAGVVSQSKGLDFILQALRKVREAGHRVRLYVAGYVHPALRRKYEQDNKDLDLVFLGRIPFEDLKGFYWRSDAGIISSLQEQCSYVAIEMCMFGLPVITTAVDGLDEMFTDGRNALKVAVRFSPAVGLQVDVDGMAGKIVQLIENPSLRHSLGRQARELYLKRFTLERMMEQTVELYQQIIGGTGKNE